MPTLPEREAILFNDFVGPRTPTLRAAVLEAIRRHVAVGTVDGLLAEVEALFDAAAPAPPPTDDRP